MFNAVSRKTLPRQVDFSVAWCAPAVDASGENTIIDIDAIATMAILLTPALMRIHIPFASRSMKATWPNSPAWKAF
jgi:hypothetical protein